VCLKRDLRRSIVRLSRRGHLGAAAPAAGPAKQQNRLVADALKGIVAGGDHGLERRLGGRRLLRDRLAALGGDALGAGQKVPQLRGSSQGFARCRSWCSLDSTATLRVTVEQIIAAQDGLDRLTATQGGCDVIKGPCVINRRSPTASAQEVSVFQNLFIYIIYIAHQFRRRRPKPIDQHVEQAWGCLSSPGNIFCE